MLRSLFRKPKPSFHLDWLQLEVSATCNSSCLYCPQHTHRTHWRDGLMDWSTFERLEPAFRQTDLVYLQGWGEPLLHPDFWRMVRRVRTAGASAGFTTNGTLLNSANRKNLIECGVNIVAVSLAGSTASTHNRFRSGCQFAPLDEAMAALRDFKQSKSGRAPDVHLAFLLLRSNLEELPGLVPLARRWAASEIVVSNPTLTGTPETRREAIPLHPELWPRAQQLLEQTQRTAADIGISLHYASPSLGGYQPVCPENVLKACFVSHLGDASPCVFTNLSIEDPATNAPPATPVIFGNVNDQPLSELWFSTEWKRFRSIFRTRFERGSSSRSSLPPFCRNCPRIRGC